MYHVVCFFLRIFLRILFRFRSIGMENIPKSGAAIILANHVSYLDPPALSAFSPRHVHFMAKEELFKIPGLSFFWHSVGTFPVRRGVADRRAIRQALEYISKGEVIALFPEGKRVAPGEVAPGELGAALIAYKSKAAVIPAAILGTQPWWRKHGQFSWFSQVIVHYGPPIELVQQQEDVHHNEKSVLEENTRRIMNAIQQLREIK